MKKTVNLILVLVLSAFLTSCQKPAAESVGKDPVTAADIMKATPAKEAEEEKIVEAEAEKTEEEDLKAEVSTVETPSVEAQPSGTQKTGRLAVWPVYWDNETVMSELSILQDKIDTVCYFAAYFDASNEPFIPEGTLQTLGQVNAAYADKGWTTYLTFVNDKILADGKSSLKDTELLYALLAQPESREKHINTILNMVAANGFNGVEIDYEAIKKDMELWKLFVTFVEELNVKATEKGIAVRIVLEPNTPADSLQFPTGPEYVIMCYNLFGYGTEPGPKANKDFLIKMAQLLDKLPAPGNMALSLGGFDFAADGSVAQLTEQECVSLLNNSGNAASRDSSSQDVVFQYTAADGSNHEVWYADYETLQYWMSVGKSCGYQRFTIWRLGRNVTLR